MSDEQEGSTSDWQRSPPISPEGEKKPKRKPRRPAELKPSGLPSTQAGKRVADQLRRKLIEMVDAAALTEANRRRATALDATDYEAGFDRIAGPARRENIVVIVADLAGAVGTGLLGYAINVYTGATPDISKGHLTMIGGVALVTASIVLKYGPRGE
jgi:hypothetical protein